MDRSGRSVSRRQQGCSEKVGDQYRDETMGATTGPNKLPFRSPYVSFSDTHGTIVYHTQNVRFRGVELLVDAREKRPNRDRFQTCVYHF